MSIHRRLAYLERTAKNKENTDLTQRMRVEDERVRAHASPEALARYNAATERMAAAHEATEADTEEMGAACDEYLDALEYLDNELRRVD
jgi:hypothetical protein